jgi:pimeloyl-ACP methyl ester carboxylesterase
MLRKIYLTILNYTNRLFPFNNFIDGLFIHLNMLKSPDAFFIYGLRSLRLISGMKVKYVSRKEGTGVWCYAEKGKKTSRYPTMVFLHGFGGDKDQWPNVIARIPVKYHSVVIDMPGHGETTFLKGFDESNLMSYVRGLREFLQVSGLDQEPIFLIG